MMRSALSELIAEARSAQRPKWSQQFLADELSRYGQETTREQIARLERSAPFRVNPQLLAAAALLLRVEHDALSRAILRDYATVAERLEHRLSLEPAGVGPAPSAPLRARRA